MPLLSRNFRLSEFQCPCGNCGDLIPTRTLVLALQELRDLTGKPIKILQGGRCLPYNRSIGSKDNSRHVPSRQLMPPYSEFDASDIHIADHSVEEMFDAVLQIKDFEDGGIGIYPDNNFVHVDTDHDRKRRRWARVKGKYVSLQSGLARIKQMNKEEEKDARGSE